MKYKVLRHKETKEFVIIDEINDNFFVGTCSTPRLMGVETNFEMLSEYYKSLGIDISDCELIILDLINSDEIGADIRNKLTPSKNLSAMVLKYINSDNESQTSRRLLDLIESECFNVQNTVEYLSNILEGKTITNDLLDVCEKNG